MVRNLRICLFGPRVYSEHRYLESTLQSENDVGSLLATVMTAMKGPKGITSILV
jgi:hypothetical protein